MTLKLGRKRPVARCPRLRLGSYLMRGLPVPPVTVDYTQAALAVLAQVLGNDKLGDCLAEGTVVASGDTLRAYRGYYEGPIAILTTASGKKLAVTPNHAVLTEHGFQRAFRLQHGDNLVCASRPEIFPGPTVVRGQAYVNHSPAPIEEIFSSSLLTRNSIVKVMPTTIDFHGDERSLNGDVEIVGANGFLGRKFHAALRQPHAKKEIRPARQLQRFFVGEGATFLSSLRSFATTLGNMSVGGQGSAFSYAHAGVPQSDILTQRAQRIPGTFDGQPKSAGTYARFLTQALKRFAGGVSLNPRRQIAVALPDRHFADRATSGASLHASRDHPSIQGCHADPDLASNLFDALPGLIEADRVLNIDFQRFAGHIYDLSTSSRYYSANGIIAHNCTAAGAFHIDGVMLGNAGQPTWRSIPGGCSAQ